MKSVNNLPYMMRRGRKENDYAFKIIEIYL